MSAIITVDRLSKTYANGFEALKGVSIDIEEGEIIALLGPNGAGKTTLISAICGLVNPSGGTVTVGGHDILEEYREARRLIGLVPQEISIEPFETVWNTTRLSRGLFGLPPDPGHLETVLKSLSLWDKKDNRNVELSGGMKRRVLIAKALSHEPSILFLDEPSAGVDVSLRKEMWALVEDLRAAGTTIILTTHYIEEAEEIADRIAVINHGEILLVEDKAALMKKLGQKHLTLDLSEALSEVPEALRDRLVLSADGRQATYAYDSRAERTGIRRLMADLDAAGITFSDLSTSQSSLEDIFVGLVQEDA